MIIKPGSTFRHAILDKIDALLLEAKSHKSQILTANIWLKDITRDFAPFNTVWVKWIDPNHKPVRATVEANLCFPSLLIEIQVSAAVME